MTPTIRHRPPLTPETAKIVDRLFERYCLRAVAPRLEPNTRETGSST